MLRIKHLITGHYRHQILCLTQIDDVVRPTGNHMNCLNLVPEYLKFHHLAGIDITLLNQTMTGYHDEQLPLTVVSVLTFRNTGLGNIDGHLSAILRM